jgi:ABC-type uncharacterized transport system substrate-binding protein
MKNKITTLALGAMLFALCASAEAQQPGKVPRVGYQTASSPGGKNEAAFRQGLRELGYVEGQNIVIEWRFARGKLDQVTKNSAGLVRLKVDVIVTGGSADTRAAKAATRTIPIVMTNESDPVGNGTVASLARPGGNITGLASLSAELTGKLLELLKETVPRLSHAATLGRLTEGRTGRWMGRRFSETVKETEAVARSLGFTLQFQLVKVPDDLNRAFEQIAKAHTEALIITNGPWATALRKRIVEFTASSQLPAIYYRREFVDDGGLMSYSARRDDLARRAAIFVDKILKGAKPAELPVEQPTKFEFIINLKAAKQIGLTIPPNVLARADKVIR